MSYKKLSVSRWVIAIYTLAAAALIPWTIFLAGSLPSRKIAHHWDVAWVGFDIFMLVLAALTALFAYRRSARVILTATSLATVLLVDTWFDVLTARPGRQQHDSILFALIVEIPLAPLTFSLVHRTLTQVNWEKNKTMRVGK